jgi:dTDP-4-dehydrorhamnose 3,5-epimerase
MTDGTKDLPHISPTGRLTRTLLHGSSVRDSHHIVTANGITTELHREDWGVIPNVRHAIHVALRPGALSAWHLHRLKTDHLLVLDGHLRVVLYDGRSDSPTHGQVDVHHVAGARPQLLVIPPDVWHGIQNLGAGAASFVNYFDVAYDHGDPDEYRLPPDSDEIPYRFPA